MYDTTIAAKLLKQLEAFNYIAKRFKSSDIHGWLRAKKCE